MSSASRVNRLKILVLAGAIALFAAWMAANSYRLVQAEGALLRLILAPVLSFLILLRGRKTENTPAPVPDAGRRKVASLCLLAVAGAFAAVAGKIFCVGQVEWIGVLCVIAASLLYTLPPRMRRAVPASMVMLYFAHPLPSSITSYTQLSMQRMSVAGSEWLLHILNVRVWADGIILHTGLNVYEIPQWCSGMRTATTVFILGMGLALFRQFSKTGTILVAVAALLQALILNILRISLVVILADKMTDPTGIKALHDSAGMIAVAAIVIVYIEIHALQKLKMKAVPDENIFLRRITSGLPVFWCEVSRRKWILFLAGILLVFSAGAVYKSRPYHRAEMIKPVAEALRDSGRLDAAQLAAEKVRKYEPYDADWDLVRIRILLLRDRYHETLESIERHVSQYSFDEKLGNSPRHNLKVMELAILRAYCNLKLGEIDKAVEATAIIPADQKHGNPAVAMVMAEINYFLGNPDAVAEFVGIASQHPSNTDRMRRLFPYLRQHRKWAVIADADRWRKDPSQLIDACIVAEAYMNLDNAPQVARIASFCMAQWPEEPQILEMLYFMCLRFPLSDWENKFADHLLSCIRAIEVPDVVFSMINKCAQIMRPDLMWICVRRLQTFVPEHPYIYLAPAYFGESWFRFKKSFLGIQRPGVTDMTHLYRMAVCFEPWASLYWRIPFGPSLSGDDNTAVRKELLSIALKMMWKQPREMSRELFREFVHAEEIAGNPDRAKKLLKERVAEYPGESDEARILLSEILEREQKWHDVYELLREEVMKETPDLLQLMRLARAQMNLSMAISAQYTAERAAALYPFSGLAAGMLAEVLLACDAPEEALSALGGNYTWHDRSLDFLEATCLHRTQRYVEMQEFCRRKLILPIEIPEPARQEEYLAPAETALLWHKKLVMPEDVIREHAAKVRSNLQSATSPFLKSVLALWLECYQNEHNKGRDTVETWSEQGRDRIEKAFALNMLTILLCQQERNDEARMAAGVAVKYFPESPVLWRILIGLSGADVKVLEAAKRYCARDPEIWLGDIVSKAERMDGGRLQVETELSGEIAGAGSRGIINPAAMARAAEFCERKKFHAAADQACLYAAKNARGLLPVYMVSLHCALMRYDRDSALKSLRAAIDCSLKVPDRYYEKLIQLKSIGGNVSPDAETVTALTKLTIAHPDEKRWTEMLAHIRFDRGGWEAVESFYQMEKAIALGATNKPAYLAAAEASRIAGNPLRGVELLRTALHKFPGDPDVLNNLAYTLACVEDTNLGGTGAAMKADAADAHKEAISVLERLLAEHPENAMIQDTAAFVYLQNSRFAESAEYSAKVLKEEPEGSLLWFRAKLHQAELALRRGFKADSVKILQSIMSSTKDIPDEEVLRANRLYGEAARP